MADINSKVGRYELQAEYSSSAQLLGGSRPASMASGSQIETTIPFRTYKRRFFGLAQLVGLNLIVSWNWLTFASIPHASAKYLSVTPKAVTWLSTGSLFACAIGAPPMLWAIGKHGPKSSIVIGSVIILVGAWIRYLAAQIDTGRYAVALTGQIVMAIGQPFVLSVSTRYSKMWFTEQGQVSAVAVVSLANPLGGALGEFIAPQIANNASGVPNLLLYTAIISTAVTIPAPFIPKEPPSPPSAIAASEKLAFRGSIRSLSRNVGFILIVICFQTFVALFSSTTSLFGQILIPYGFTQTEAGISGALLILAGVVISGITSPIIDKFRCFRVAITGLVPIIAACYTVMIFTPGWGFAVGFYVLCVLLGGASFSLMPAVLELMTTMTYPVSPELSTIIAWTGGDLLGGVLIIVDNALQSTRKWNGQPKGSMMKSLILQAALAWAAVVPAIIAMWRVQSGKGSRRQRKDVAV